MKRNTVAFALAILSCIYLTACNTSDTPSDSSSQEQFTEDQTEFTDDEVKYAVYSDYVWPGVVRNEFFDPALDDPAWAMLHFVGREYGEPSTVPIISCSNDYTKALEWANSAAEIFNASAGGNAGDSERSTEKFFEFTRYIPDRTYLLVIRVQKCSYYDSGNPNQYTSFPATASRVKEYGEYLWLVEGHNIGGRNALSSFTEESASTIRHSLYYTETTYGDWNMTDQIRLLHRTMDVDVSTGIIVRKEELVKTVIGEYTPNPIVE